MQLLIKDNLRWRLVSHFQVQDAAAARQIGELIAALSARAGVPVELAIRDAMDVTVEQLRSWEPTWVVPKDAEGHEWVP
jgi:hypothetical protein